MNRILLAFFVTALLCGNLLAQSQQSPNRESMPPEAQAPSATQPAPATATAPASAAPKLAPGSVIPVQLTKSVDAKKVKTGDEVVAKVTQDLRNNAGTIIVAKDTKVIGHVTEAQARNKEQKESELTIAFDHMMPKNGESMQMPMSIQAIIAPQNPNSANAAGGQQSAQPASNPVPDTGGSSNGRPGMGGMAGGTNPQAASVPPDTSMPSGAPTGSHAQPPITGNTRGVVGIPNLNLAAAPDATQGTVVSSEKNNVKLDDGIFLLLRVN
ncbi:MAG: hypothetical protein WBD25_18180 [Terriglobales bacterium]|jgi:hypothetical protein